ncbi:hypothetical protein ACFQX6_06755 [Streptosporangium lutulentum]
MDGNARYGPPVAVDGGGTSLDYYLVFAGADDRGRGAPPSGNLIEEFLLCDDYTAAGLDSVEWTPRPAPGVTLRRRAAVSASTPCCVSGWSR